MERLRRLLKTVIYPPIPLIMIAAPAATVLLLYVFFDRSAPAAARYAAYLTSACILFVLCARLPGIISGILQLKNSSRLLKRYTTDVRWRVQTTLQGSLVTNGLYAGLQLISGIHSGTSWNYALSVYYALLAVMRWVLLRYISSNEPGSDITAEYRRCRLCGVMMLMINQALIAIVGMIVIYDRGVSHPPVITIAMAVYTFTLLPLAVKNLITFRRYASPVLSAAKVLSLTSALVSLLSLETAMLAAFGSADTVIFRRIITGSTGLVICAAELAMAIHMIVHSTRRLKKPDHIIQHGRRSCDMHIFQCETYAEKPRRTIT